MGLANWLTLLRILLIPVFVTLLVYRRPGVALLVFAVAVISRDVILVVGALLIYMLGGRIRPRPTWAGKAATFFQVLTVLTGLLARFFQVQLAPRPVLWLAAAFTIISGLQYIIQGMRFLNASASVEREDSPEDALYR